MTKIEARQKPGDEFNAPIFIGGPDRCGKTTLRSFLVSHPNISIPLVGSNMWTFFYNQYGDLSRPDNFERCLEAMLNYKHVAFLNPSPARLRREFYTGKPTYARLFGLIQTHYAEQMGKPRWGDQTGLVERYADQIFSAYPGARMLHMIRDPRDRYEASLSRFPDGKGRAGGAAARWLYSSRLALRNLRRYPRQYKIVTFESLILDTEPVLEAICAFLGETYDPDMLQMNGAPIFKEKLQNSNPLGKDRGLLSKDFIGRYKRRLSDEDIRFIQLVTKKHMLRYEYELEPAPLSPGLYARYVFGHVTVNFLKMTAWLGREFLQTTLPGWVKRKPGSHMDLAEKKEAVRTPAVVDKSVEMPESEPPVFIGGIGRSGKTYMRFMLESLPNLAISRRTGLWPVFYGKFGDLSIDENLDRCLLALDKKKHVRLLQPDMKEIRAAFRNGPPTYPQLFSKLHEHYARKLGKSRWGDQTEALERYADKIMESYHGAKFIQMVRDPRDRFEALVARNPQARSRLGIETARWIESWDLGQALKRKYPGHFRVVHYEELVRDPETVMKSLCEFVGEEYDEEIIRMRRIPRFREIDLEPDQVSPLSADYVGRYREGLSEFQKLFIQRAVGERLNQAGYGDEEKDFTWSERARYSILFLPVFRLQLQAAKLVDRLKLARRVQRPAIGEVA